jgi:hypothetical protein
MAKNKKLTSNAVKAKKEELKASVIKEVVIGGDTYEFKVDRKFIKSKEVAFTNDLISFVSEIGTDEKYFDLGEIRIQTLSENYALLMLIKHFTSIDVPEETEDALTVLRDLADLGVFNEVIEALPEDEIERVMTQATVAIDEFSGKLSESLDKLREEADKVKKELEEKEALNEELIKAEEIDSTVVVE